MRAHAGRCRRHNPRAVLRPTLSTFASPLRFRSACSSSSCAAGCGLRSSCSLASSRCRPEVLNGPSASVRLGLCPAHRGRRSAAVHRRQRTRMSVGCPRRRTTSTSCSIAGTRCRPRERLSPSTKRAGAEWNSGLFEPDGDREACLAPVRRRWQVCLTTHCARHHPIRSSRPHRSHAIVGAACLTSTLPPAWSPRRGTRSARPCA